VQESDAPIRASLAKQPDDVSAMFDVTAPRYDLMNALASVGQDHLWRIATRRAIKPLPGEHILDLAAGTGTSSVPLARAGAIVTAADRSTGMVEVGQVRHPGLRFVVADAERLPFADASFDAVTISFGLRNVQRPDVALSEMLRVTRPGGRLVVCEFSTPPNSALRAGYRVWLTQVLSRLARLGSNPASYDYLVESILAWRDQRGLARLLRECGWTDVAWRNLSAGIVALHRAVRPLDDAVRPEAA